MTLYQFKTLDEEEQYNTVWNNGVFIAVRISKEDKFLLYQIDGFYVELKYDVNINKIVELRSFGNVSRLEPYLINIPLPSFD